MKFASGSSAVQTSHLKGWVVFFIFLALIILFLRLIVGFITDWLWFLEVRYERIFTITLRAQMEMALLFGIAFFVVLFGNLHAAVRLSSKLNIIERDGVIHIPSLNITNQTLRAIILICSIFFSVFAALSGANQWDTFLQFLNASPFGIKDPLFQRDVGFYVFQLPFLQYLYGWLMTVLIITVISTTFLYVIRRAFLIIPPRK